jgi:hypothetical protein
MATQFHINILFENHLAWYDVVTDDYKSYELNLFAFKAYQQTSPPAKIYMFKSEGRWQNDADPYYKELARDLGAMIEEWERAQ